MKDKTTLTPYLRLRFNIDHPSLEECYVFGYECAAAELSEEENPYAAGTEEHDQWSEGWWAGFYGEEPLFSLSEQIEEEELEAPQAAANDQWYHHPFQSAFLSTFLKITGALAATAVVGYQVLDLVA
ncbi:MULTISPECIES: transmission trait enhancer LetE [Legionella]|uniref:Transmission trait enhancer LetE n=1 Tax=Legionella quinlivanii TaxID=45073 RepID=A0A364LK09_9GAMM|nr:MULTISPECIES: transmission trait enhancer LetE [Legionella]MCE3045188.1 transmission trait enhancer LetE [Legionella sp. 16cNR16C]RAP36819.1 transmission trait enhancer LetE [Legionella quinlivanii]